VSIQNQNLKGLLRNLVRFSDYLFPGILNMGLALGCLQVEQSTVAIREVFGKYEDVLEPGCHCVPWFMGRQIAGYLSLRVQQLDVRCETKTKVCSEKLKFITKTNMMMISLCSFLQINVACMFLPDLLCLTTLDILHPIRTMFL